MPDPASVPRTAPSAARQTAIVAVAAAGRYAAATSVGMFRSATCYGMSVCHVCSLVGGLRTVNPAALKARLAPPVRSLGIVAIRL
jgi:hypothetical protein